MLKFLKKYKLDILSFIYPIFSVIIILSIWALTAHIVGSDLLLPSIRSTFNEIGNLLVNSQTYTDIFNTLKRSIQGFAISFCIAFVFSLIAVFVKPFSKIFAPIVAVLRATPTMSVILLCLLWTSSYVTPVFVTVLIIFPLLYTAFYGAISGVDSKLVEMARVYKVPFVKRLTGLYIPSVLPQVLNAVRSTLSLTIKLTIASEVLAQTRDSIGVDMQLANLYLETPTLIAWTVIAVVLGAIAEAIIIIIQKLLVRWKIDQH